MSSIKHFLAIFLLSYSAQSFALFMPAGVHVNTVTVEVSNNVGC